MSTIVAIAGAVLGGMLGGLLLWYGVGLLGALSATSPLALWGLVLMITAVAAVVSFRWARDRRSA